MSSKTEKLSQILQRILGDAAGALSLALGEVTLVVSHEDYLHVMQTLRDAEELRFEQMMDLCGVDYSEYGEKAWRGAEEMSERDGMQGARRAGTGVYKDVHEDSESAASAQANVSGANVKQSGRSQHQATKQTARAAISPFAVVVHLLSLTYNWRVRVRVFAPEGEMPILPTITGIWPNADWYEREAFDLYGILFEGHPDLRRILTDYGFVGHPFRKDFPVSGYVEMRYDEQEKRIVYQPVTIEPREQTRRVIREDDFGRR